MAIIAPFKQIFIKSGYKKSLYCIKVAMNQLNWQPKISLHNGLNKTINYFTNYLKDGE